MKSITIAAVRSADAAYRYADDGSGTVKAVEVAVLLTTGYGDKAITAEAICTAYGKAADALKEIDSEFIIVTGDVELPKGEAMRINNCRFYPGSMGLQLNQVSVAGNIGNEPEIQRFERGMVAKFSVAARRTKDVTDWFNCEIWGKQAEVVEKFVGKGNQIAVVGGLKLEQWNDKQTGALRTAYRFNMDRLTLLGGKRTQESAPTQGEQTSYEDDF
jgi:single-strand DNA-binding protein